MTPVHPILEEFIYYLFKALICCPWGDVELGRQVAECLLVPQFELIVCLPQDLLLRKCQGEAAATAPATLPLPAHSNKLVSKDQEKHSTW